MIVDIFTNIKYPYIPPFYLTIIFNYFLISFSEPYNSFFHHFAIDSNRVWLNVRLTSEKINWPIHLENTTYGILRVYRSGTWLPWWIQIVTVVLVRCVYCQCVCFKKKYDLYLTLNLLFNT